MKLTDQPRPAQHAVHKAFEGAHGAFLVTGFWAHGSAAEETEEIGVLVRAAEAAGLRHVMTTNGCRSSKEVRRPALRRQGRG